MFHDRTDAGERLAAHLTGYESPLLLGLIRGGLPVAAAAARRLGAEYDGLVVRKAAPEEDREFGEGAVAPGGIEVGNPPPGQKAKAEAELRRRVDAYLDGVPAPNARGRLVVLVDDGLATGVTAIAAVRYVRTLSPQRVIVAVPVLSRTACEAVSQEADEVVWLETPEPFHRVEDAYTIFDEVSDEEVKNLLAA